MNLRRPVPFCWLVFALGVLPSVAAGAAGTTLQGVVRGAAQAPLNGVRVFADEFGVSQDTGAKGRFSLTVPPDIAAKGQVRLTFSLKDHLTYSDVFKVFRPITITLFPLYPRTSQPNLPSDSPGRLRRFRAEEIRRVQAFLGSKEKKLFSVAGLASGSADLLLVALQDRPRALAQPVLWWDCEEDDSLTLLAEEWSRAFNDQNLANLLPLRDEVKTQKDHRDLDREILARLLDHFKTSPYTVVLNHFDHWLASSGAPRSASDRSH